MQVQAHAICSVLSVCDDQQLASALFPDLCDDDDDADASGAHAATIARITSSANTKRVRTPTTLNVSDVHIYSIQEQQQLRSAENKLRGLLALKHTICGGQQIHPCRLRSKLLDLCELGARWWRSGGEQSTEACSHRGARPGQQDAVRDRLKPCMQQARGRRADCGGEHERKLHTGDEALCPASIASR